MERTRGAEWAKRGGWQVRREEKTDWGEGGVEKEWVAGSKRVEGGSLWLNSKGKEMLDELQGLDI